VPPVERAERRAIATRSSSQQLLVGLHLPPTLHRRPKL
jgi:hypothetical protein